MSKLTDFIGQLTSGLARANRYTVEMTLPQGLNIHPSDQQRVALLCESVTIPSLNVNTVQIRTFGEVREMPTEFNYDPITLTFYVDGDMIVKDAFDKWIKSVQNGSTRTFNYYNNYICPKMKIYVEDLLDEKIYENTVYEAWPKTVQAVQMSYDQKDVMKLTVTMMFKYWESRLMDADFTATQTPQIFGLDNQQPEFQNVITNITQDEPLMYVDPMGNIAYKF